MAKAKKSDRVKMDTEKFEDVWVALHKADGKDTKKYTMKKFMAVLGPKLGVEISKLNESSVRSKCYNLNKKAEKEGYTKLAVPGTGGTGGNDTDWDVVFKGRTKAT